MRNVVDDPACADVLIEMKQEIRNPGTDVGYPSSEAADGRRSLP